MAKYLLLVMAATCMIAAIQAYALPGDWDSWEFPWDIPDFDLDKPIEESGQRQKRQSDTFLCNGSLGGYRCDGPVERGIWRAWNRLKGVTSCSSLCRSQGKRGGRCTSGATDRSTWCPRGQYCKCY